MYEINDTVCLRGQNVINGPEFAPSHWYTPTILDVLNPLWSIEADVVFGQRLKSCRQVEMISRLAQLVFSEHLQLFALAYVFSEFTSFQTVSASIKVFF